MSKDEKISPAPVFYKVLDDYPGIDLDKTRARFEELSDFFIELLDGYVTKIVDKYGEVDDYLSKEDHLKEMLLHDPLVRDILTRSICYPPFKLGNQDPNSIQLELDF